MADGEGARVHRISTVISSAVSAHPPHGVQINVFWCARAGGEVAAAAEELVAHMQHANPRVSHSLLAALLVAARASEAEAAGGGEPAGAEEASVGIYRRGLAAQARMAGGGEEGVGRLLIRDARELFVDHLDTCVSRSPCRSMPSACLLRPYMCIPIFVYT